MITRRRETVEIARGKVSDSMFRRPTGFGYPPAHPGWLDVAIFLTYAIFGVIVFGRDSHQAAVMALPLSVLASLWIVSAIELTGRLLACRRQGVRLWIVIFGPIHIEWTRNGVSVSRTRGVWQLGGIVIPIAPPEKVSELTTMPGVANRRTFVLLVIATLVFASTSAVAIIDSASWMIWLPGCLMAGLGLAFFSVALLKGLNPANPAGGARPSEEACSISNALNSATQAGVRPAAWDLDAIDRGIDLARKNGVPISGGSYFGYCTLADRGNLNAAGQYLFDAVVATREDIRAHQERVSGTMHIFAEMAFFVATETIDAAASRSWLYVVQEHHIRPTLRARCDAALLFADGRYAESLAAARRGLDLFRRLDVSGSDVFERGRLDYVYNLAVDAERDSSSVERARVHLPEAPLIVNGLQSSTGVRAAPWLALFLFLFLGAVILPSDGWLVDRAFGEPWLLRAMVVPAMLLCYFLYSHCNSLLNGCWLEIDRDGVTGVTGNQQIHLEWSRFVGWGRLQRSRFAPTGLILGKVMDVAGPSGRTTRVAGVSIGHFMPKWRDNEVGRRIRQFAPHLLDRRVEPPESSRPDAPIAASDDPSPVW